MERCLSVALLCCFVLLLIGTPGEAQAGGAAGAGGSSAQKVVIWYLPHPDDETIGMAGAILASHAAGHRNIFVFLTRGGGSLVGYIDGLRLAQTKASRMQEAITALQHLGAKRSDIIFYDFIDGNVSLEATLAIMRAYREQYPNAAHRTVSFHDPHPDHKAVALALAKLQTESQNLDAAYYHVYIYNKPLEQRGNNQVAPELVPDLARKRLAIAAYTSPDERDGRHAIGGRSVAPLLASAADDLYEYRDIRPPVCGFQPVFLSFRPNAVGAASEYATISDWSLITRMEIGKTNLLAVRLQKNLLTLPWRTTLYAGSEYLMRQHRSGSSHIIAGLNLVGSVYLEYHLDLGSMHASRSSLEIRWYPPWSRRGY